MTYRLSFYAYISPVIGSYYSPTCVALQAVHAIAAVPLAVMLKKLPVYGI